MSDGYGIDLEAFSLNTLKDFLAYGDLLPSHQVLRDNLETHFAALAARGLSNVQQLVETLTTKKALERFASQTAIPLDYLTILRRHVRGYIPSAVNFDEIPGLEPQIVQRLEAAGIKHTRHFYERARTRAARDALAQQAGIPATALLELLQLTDLSRLGWVGPIGVRLFHAAGAHTVQVLQSLDPDAFYERVTAVNRERQYTKVTLARKDIALTVEMAKKLPNSIEY